MNYSEFGEKFGGNAGILTLMDDLGHAMAEGDMIMMGGGNPGYLPAIQDVMKRQLLNIAAEDAQLRKLIGIYDPPTGDLVFLEALAGLLRQQYGWDLTSANICLTNGSQCAFFLLFNMFAGNYPDGSRKKILLPMAPEYIGYADLGLCGDFFTSVKPQIEYVEEPFFKYRVDFNKIEPDHDIGAMCVSRPTNPTGNVLTDNEIQGLTEIAGKKNIPLIIDSAYGIPFPGMIFIESMPFWNNNIILSMSLSKLGLPAVRSGIVIASEEIISTLAAINSVINLAPGSLGAMMTTPLIESGEILALSREVVRPFYQEKMEKAVAWVQQYLAGCRYRIHVPEGAMFLWLWFPDLAVSSRELYRRLKKRQVLVVAGEYFFPGLQEDWQHVHECIRVTYSQDEEQVCRGIQIIGEEVRRIYDEEG